MRFDDSINYLWFGHAGVADIPWAGYWNGQTPQLMGYGGSDHQRFHRYSPSTNRWGEAIDKGEWQQIRTKFGGNYCLDIKEGRTEPGTPIQIWECGNAYNKNQLFRFI